MSTTKPQPARAEGRGSGYEYGVLLPHFGAHASRVRLLDAARSAEAYGFDSVWVRDHLIYRPHAFEDPDATHVDPLVVLSSIASITEKVTLAVGTLIPHRHPIHAALMLASLELMAGPGRVIAAWGLGAYDHEFEAIGTGAWDRRKLVPEQIAIVRRLWGGAPVSYRGNFYQFDDVQVRPAPGPNRMIPIWYGGSSMAAVRRAAEFCDDWIPGPIPMLQFRQRIARLRQLAERAGRPPPAIGAIPSLAPARSIDEGASYLNLPALTRFVTRLYGQPQTRSFRTLADLDGAAIAGPPDVIVEEVRRYQAAGLNHFVFDFRARFADFEECLAMLGEEVLPNFTEKTADHRRSPPPESAGVRQV